MNPVVTITVAVPSIERTPFIVGVVINVFIPDPERVRLLNVYGATVCEPAALHFKVPVEAVNVPPVPRVPPRLIIPVPENVNLACAAVPENVMLPVVVIVPVEIDNRQYRVDELPPAIAILPAFMDPVPTEMVVLTLLVADNTVVIAPETLSVFVPLIVIPLFAVGTFIVMLPTFNVFASTVTITPELIVTASPVAGTDSPPHVTVLLQLPVTDAILDAA